MISFKDEGEQEEKISENVSAERDLDDVKSSLVNESESSSDSEVRGAEGRGLERVCRQKVSVVCSTEEKKTQTCVCVRVRVFVCVSKQRGAPRPEPTWKVTRERGIISAKVNGGGGGRTGGRKRNLREISTPACPALIPSSLPLLPLHPRSAEKAARWWPFQESPLPWLPVPHDPGPHQPLPVQRLAVPRCQNSKLSLLTPLSTPLQSSPKPSPVSSFPPLFIVLAVQRNREGRWLSKKQQKLA